MDLIAAFLLGAAFSAIVLDHRKTHSRSGYSEPVPIRGVTTQTSWEEMNEDQEA